MIREKPEIPQRYGECCVENARRPIPRVISLKGAIGTEDVKQAAWMAYADQQMRMAALEGRQQSQGSGMPDAGDGVVASGAEPSNALVPARPGPAHDDGDAMMVDAPGSDASPGPAPLPDSMADPNQTLMLGGLAQIPQGAQLLSDHTIHISYKTFEGVNAYGLPIVQHFSPQMSGYETSLADAESVVSAAAGFGMRIFGWAVMMGEMENRYRLRTVSRVGEI